MQREQEVEFIERKKLIKKRRLDKQQKRRRKVAETRKYLLSDRRQ